ncbi:MAG: Smr/MutS family protein [Fimbriimonadales bacterium]
MKAFAYQHPRLINAAMEFDLESLQPTYRLLLGAPGASHAIEIARRLGLPERVARAATETLGAQEATLTAMIQDLERARRAAEDAETEWRAKLNALQTRERQLDALRDALEAEKRTLKQRAQQELDAYLAQIRAEAEQILRQLRQAPRESKQTAELREQLTRLIDNARIAPQTTTAPADAPPTTSWRVGMRVRVRSIGQIATLAEPPHGAYAQVYLGKVRMPVPISDLEPLPEPDAPKPQVRASKPRVGYVPLELDLHGMRVEEAQPFLEKYLDDALLAGYESVRVQHGKGTGALRQMVWDYLKRHPQVRSYHHPPNADGGEGVTVVLFKKR